ncbi:PKD2-like protein [Mya arenaria]|uniref:PKD2-like protein n=1 Tax=Mya arenaria TaxID=6604 RepID=A0ABY7D9E9_MYAAR|nr:PKD2-like protein [Mya arenaria]
MKVGHHIPSREGSGNYKQSWSIPVLDEGRPSYSPTGEDRGNYKQSWSIPVLDEGRPSYSLTGEDRGNYKQSWSIPVLDEGKPSYSLTGEDRGNYKQSWSIPVFDEGKPSYSLTGEDRNNPGVSQCSMKVSHDISSLGRTEATINNPGVSQCSMKCSMKVGHHIPSREGSGNYKQSWSIPVLDEGRPSYSLTGEDRGNYKQSWSIPVLDEEATINNPGVSQCWMKVSHDIPSLGRTVATINNPGVSQCWMKCWMKVGHHIPSLGRIEATINNPGVSQCSMKVGHHIPSLGRAVATINNPGGFQCLMKVGHHIPSLGRTVATINTPGEDSGNCKQSWSIPVLDEGKPSYSLTSLGRTVATRNNPGGFQCLMKCSMKVGHHIPSREGSGNYKQSWSIPVLDEGRPSYSLTGEDRGNYKQSWSIPVLDEGRPSYSLTGEDRGNYKQSWSIPVFDEVFYEGRPSYSLTGEGSGNYKQSWSIPVLYEGRPSYSLTGEDSGNYKQSWSIPVLDEDYAINPWIHQSGWSLKTLPFVGSHATYSGGGYVLPLSGQEQRDTVFLEFTFYNPNVDMFTVGVYMFEFTNTGGVYPSHQEISTSLHHYSSSYGKFVAVCEVLFAAFNLTFIIIEVKKFRKQGKSEYFSSIWTIIELCQIGMAVAVVVMFVQRVLAVGSVMDDFKSSKGETFVSFYPAVFWDAVLMYVMGGLMTTVILITIKLLIFNRKMFLLSYTLSAVHMHLLSFLLIFAITTFAFAAFSYLLFNSVFRGYKTLGDALVSNVSLLMGIADFVGLYEYNRIIGVVFLFSFVFTVYFGVMTFVQAILNVGRIEARDRIKGKKNHLDHINYITSKLKMLVQQK